METIIILVFVALFVIIAIILSKKWKNAYLDTLPMLEGEKVIFEDPETDVELKAYLAPNIDRLPKTFIRITNLRIIIAQKVLFQEKFFVKYIIHYTGEPIPEGVAGGAFKTGMITYETDSNHISYTEDKKTYVNIEPSKNPTMGIPVWLKIFTDQSDQYKQFLSR